MRMMGLYNISYICLCIWSLSLLETVNGQDCKNTYSTYFNSPGDIKIAGLFDIHKGVNCSETVAVGLQQVTNLATIVHILNSIQYIPGLTIGTALYDLCSVKESAAKALISSRLDGDCKLLSNNLGILTTPKILSQEIKDLSKSLNVPVYSLSPSTNTDLYFKIAIHLLIELHSTVVDVVAMPSLTLLNRFIDLATAEGICLLNQLSVISDLNTLCLGEDSVIILGISEKEVDTLLKIDPECSSQFVIMLFGNDVDFEVVSGNLRLKNDTYLIIPSNLWTEPITPLENDFDGSLKIIEDNTPYLNITLDFLQMASLVLEILDFSQQTADCLPSVDCPKFETDAANKLSAAALTHDHIFNISKILHLDERNLISYVVLLSENQNLLCMAETKIKNREWILEFNFGLDKNLNDDLLLCDFDNEKNFGDPLCRNCSNNGKRTLFSIISVANNHTNEIFAWKTDIWVPSILTISIIGIIACVSVFIFIMRRIRSKDILEGNPLNSILLVLSTIFMYLTVLPFCVNLKINPSAVCATKLFGTTLSYNLIFSLILSRTLMILTCDYQSSFMSHINGYLNACLCFFMIFVQLALLIQFSILNYNRIILNGSDYCQKLTEDTNLFLLFMIYNVFLLSILTCISPFIWKSKRNYKEGVCFGIGNCFLAITWILWCSFYIFAGQEWKDFSTAFGLSTSASIIIICVFIPKTYLIMNGVIRDEITNALPNYYSSNSMPNISNMKYRSTHALYDSVNVENAAPSINGGQTNIGYYYDSPTNSNFDENHRQIAASENENSGNMRICTIDNNNYENFSQNCNAIKESNNPGTSKF